ncbi:MAG: transcription antitermination factor NusB [Clostridia bacterium]|nr:transcription antitermination factor NusB [Clostridia bacterium]
MNRTQSREQAFILLFEYSFGLNTPEEIINLAQEVRGEKISNFTRNLFLGTINNLENIDKNIEEYLKNWDKSRLSRVSLAVLRLAVYEILYSQENPVSVCINEAVELTKKYALQDDASYINGVLSSIEKNKIQVS